MGGLFSKPKTQVQTVQVPEAPKARRLPQFSDSAIYQQRQLMRERARKRKGALSTILSDSLSNDAGTLG